MPSKLELQAYYINERYAKLICPFYFVSWNHQKLEWKYEGTSFRRMWPYYVLLIYLIINYILFLTTIPLIYSRSSDIDKSVTNKTLIVAGLLVLITILIMFVDYLFIVCGCEMVYATNWIFHHEGIGQHKKNRSLANKLSLRQLLKRLALSVKDLKDLDLVGIAFNFIPLVYPIVGLVTSILYVFGHFDPTFLFIDGLNLITIKESYWFFSLRVFTYLIAAQWMLHSAKTGILLCVGMCVSFIRLLLNLKRTKVQTPQSLETLLRFYKELSLLLSLLTHEINKILGNVLSLGYLLIVVGIFGIIFGVKEHDSKMIFVFLFMTTGVLFALLFVFKIGDFLYSSSSFILKRWRNKCSRWRDFKSKVLLREIDSCRLLMAKAGAISVITVELQQGFLNALLQDSVSALLLCQEEFNAF